MSPTSVSAVVFACVFGGALLGFALRAVLPERLRSPGSKDVVNKAMGLVATMSALVLGLFVADAKSKFDSQKDDLVAMCGKVLLLDQAMVHYGPEASGARAELRTIVANAIETLWQPDALKAGGGIAVYDTVDSLSPKDDRQRALRALALETAIDVGATRWLMLAKRGGSISVAFLVVVVFWL